MEDSESLRNQIDRLEGSLKHLQDQNANYADMTLVLADASQQMDNDRFVGSIVPPEKKPEVQPSIQVSQTKKEPDLDMYLEDEVSDYTYPSMGRFGDVRPIVQRESQIDLRDFNDLQAPDDLTDDYTPLPGSMKVLTDRSEDYDFDTPRQDQITESYRIENQITSNHSDFFSDQDFRVRARSKTQDQLPDKPLHNRSTRTNSELVEPVDSRGFDESLFFDNPMRDYPSQSAAHPRRVEIHHYRSDVATELSPIEDIETISNELPQMEDDCYDVDKAIATLEDDDVIYRDSNMRARRDSKRSNGEGNDSDSDMDNFISQHKQSFIQPQPEEVRSKSPYFPKPVSKSSLGCYQNVNRTVSPRDNILRKKEAPQEPHKRLTLPPQAMGSYEDYGPRTPGPYMTRNSEFSTPQPNLKFRPVSSARDVSHYDTVFSKIRNSTIDPEPEIEYVPADNSGIRRNAQRSFNRNKTTDHRQYGAYLRSDIVSPTSPPQDTSFDDQDGYDIIVNASEITNMRQPTEYRFQHEQTNRNSAYSGYNVQHKQPTRPRNEYAVPAPVGVARNHGYIPNNNNNTSPVQSTDSGIDSLFNDHRPRTAAAQTVYYTNEYDDYEEQPRESLKEMENMVSQLRNELKLLTTKVNLFESKGISIPDDDPTSPIAQSRVMPTGFPGPSMPPQARIMSPTGQQYSAYTATQLRSSSVASSNSEGSRMRQDPRHYEVGSPVTSVSPVHSYQPNPMPKYTQPRKGYSTEYEPIPREQLYQQNPNKSNLKKTVYTQSSSPSVRPKSVSKITSNTVNSTRLTYPTNTSSMDTIPNYPSANRTYTPSMSIPRAQSSTSTPMVPRLLPPRYKAGPQTNRAVSPQPMTSARKANPSRPIHSSNSHRISEGLYHEERLPNQQTYIPKPQPRYH